MTSIIRHYKKQADGTLRFVGNETREIPDWEIPHFHVDREILDMRDERLALQKGRERREFEDLVDAACDA